MNRLPSQLQDHTRSFLSFKELYANRLVCKQWNTVDDVPKSLLVHGWNTPPPLITVRNITKLNFASKYGIVAPETSAEVYADARAILHFLQQAAKSVTSIEIYFYKDWLNQHDFPDFPKLEHLRLEGNEGLFQSMMPHIATVKNNYHDNVVTSEKYDIDFALLSRLERLTIAGGPSPNIVNANQTTKFQTFIGEYKVPHVFIRNLMTSFPDLRFWSTVGYNPRLWYTRYKNKLVFKEVQWNEDNTRTDIEENLDDMKHELMEIRDFQTCEISTAENMCAAQLYDLIWILGRTEVFKKETLKMLL